MGTSQLQKRWLTRLEAAEYIGVAASTLADMAHDGRGPKFSKVGRIVRYDVRDMDAWLAANTVDSK